MRTNLQHGAEHRKYRRYNLTLPVRVKSRTSEIDAPAIETSTTNLSAHGIYLLISEDLEMDSALDLEITLPAELTGGNSVKLRCRGKVVRLEPKNAAGKFGVGAVIQDYSFIRQENRAEKNG